MRLRSRYWLAATLGLVLAHSPAGWAAEPGQPARMGPLPSVALSSASDNQKMADAIAEQLRQSGQLRRYTIDIAYRDGTVELKGFVADQTQREEALRLVQGVPGVVRVVDQLVVADAIQRVQAAEPPGAPPAKLPEPIPQRRGGDGFVTGPAGEPTPIFQAPPPGYADLNPPKMPPYAWPTYAPYNNFSRVAIPEAYPYNAWPFIGPPNPFPKVPLGWRSVKLEWEDGYWWYGRVANKCDWWRLRYW